MEGKDSKKPRFLAREFAAFWTALMLVAAFGARPATAAPFAYVTDLVTNIVSVIDTASNKVVATVPVGGAAGAVAVTPDGKRAYVANQNSNTVSVIDTAANTVVATITVGSGPTGVAVTPDGKHAYVANLFDDTVSVIDTASNAVVTTVVLGGGGVIGPNG